MSDGPLIADREGAPGRHPPGAAMAPGDHGGIDAIPGPVPARDMGALGSVEPARAGTTGPVHQPVAGTPGAVGPGTATPPIRGEAAGWRAGLALLLAEGAVLWIRVAAVLLLLLPPLLLLVFLLG